jgi:hypothetical protein
MRQNTTVQTPTVTVDLDLSLIVRHQTNYRAYRSLRCQSQASQLSRVTLWLPPNMTFRNYLYLTPLDIRVVVPLHLFVRIKGLLRNLMSFAALGA